MLTAISFATELIPYLDERDKSTLTAATGRLSGLNVRAAQHVDQVCSDLLFGNIAEQGRAEQVAALLTGGDEIQEEDARLFFEGVLDSLSEEGRTAVIGLENDIAKNNKTANWMDWLKFAELAPEEMLETATRNCESRLGVSRRQ